MDLTEIRDRVMRRTRDMRPRPSVEEVDDAINSAQRGLIQPVARIRGIEEFTFPFAEGEIPLEDIAEDIYRIDFFMDPTSGAKYGILNEDEAGLGIRIGDGRVWVKGVRPGRKVLVYYQKALPELGTGPDQVRAPVIPAIYHDIYWLGALDELKPGSVPRLNDRLRRFERERRNAGRYYGPRVHVRRIWR